MLENILDLLDKVEEDGLINGQIKRLLINFFEENNFSDISSADCEYIYDFLQAGEYKKIKIDYNWMGERKEAFIKLISCVAFAEVLQQNKEIINIVATIALKVNEVAGFQRPT